MIVQVIFPFYSQEWSKLLHHVTQYTVFGKPFNLKDKTKLHNKISLIFRSYCIIGSCLYTVAAFIYNKNCFKLRKEINVNMLCGVVPAWFPWKLNKVAEWCYYGYQLLGIIIFVTPAAAITILVWEVSTWIIMHTDVLKQSFASTLRISDIEKRRRRLSLWLSYHLYILSLSRQLNFLTKKCLGIYSLIAALLFGSIINQIHNKENTIGGIITFLGFFLAICIICQAGENISQQNRDITDAVYNSSWYMMEIKTRKDIIFILMSSNIKLYLEALPLGQLNFALLIMIMKGSFSYMTLIQNSS